MPMLSRRAALASGAAALPLIRAVAAESDGPFRLPPLPYAADANAPQVDARTMEVHHGRHHAAYVAALNRAVADHPRVAELPLEAILARLPEMPETIRATLRNNGGGHANHSMFWQVMGGRGGAPARPLAEAIARDFGSLAQMQARFNRAGAGQFGSGWVFLTVDRDGRLAVAARPNQDTPLMEGGRVLLGNDVWEHAYYLSYQNRRADYLAAWWDVVDWGRVAARYAAAQAGTLAL